MSKIFSRLFATGFFGIVGAGVLNKIVAFVSGVILVRIVSQSEYGAYSYALNIINYFVLFNGLGTAACVVQLCVERDENDGTAERVYRAACSIGMLWDVVLVVVIVLFALFIPLPVAGSNTLLLILAPFPLFSLAVDFQQQRLRSLLKNGEYALATNMNSVSIMGCSIAGAFLGSSGGLSLGRTLGMVASAFLTNRLFKIRVYLNPAKVDFRLVSDILKMAITVCFTNAIGQLLALVGTTIIGAQTANQELVAVYSVATTIPFALLFIPGMFVTYVAPYFIRHNNDRKWVLKRWAQVSGAVGLICTLIGFACIACADWLVPLIFGEQYMSAVSSFQILAAAFAIQSAFVVPSGNVLAFHRRYGLNMFITALRVAVCLSTSFILVPTLGIEGAAWGYFAAVCVASIVSMVGCYAFAGKAKAAPIFSE